MKSVLEFITSVIAVVVFLNLAMFITGLVTNTREMWFLSGWITFMVWDWFVYPFLNEQFPNLFKA